MNEPAPKGIIQSADQTQELHQRVSEHLNKAGFAVTPQSVNPEDASPLKAIEEALGNTTHVIGNTLEEAIGGSSDEARVRTVKGREPVSIAEKRGLMMRFRRRLGIDKAA